MPDVLCADAADTGRVRMRQARRPRTVSAEAGPKMTVVYTQTSKLLRYADRARTDDAIRDIDLWQLADRETATVTARVGAYRHALTHAGRLPGRILLARCPDCDARLT